MPYRNGTIQHCPYPLKPVCILSEGWQERTYFEGRPYSYRKAEASRTLASSSKHLVQELPRIRLRPKRILERLHSGHVRLEKLSSGTAIGQNRHKVMALTTTYAIQFQPIRVSEVDVMRVPILRHPRKLLSHKLRKIALNCDLKRGGDGCPWIMASEQPASPVDMQRHIL
ncbi:hypothetical protein WG66_000617 [Moniliophthora roreri]|nr:hypothetical protein WG66_000617 [Moniliophthora roreri]